ncbi:MAG: hypothetical protein AB1333_04295 [Patescibacteria group bacterium]
METITLILQILVSVIFFTNKVLLVIGKRSGWLAGAIAATLACAYFFLIELYIYTVLEIGLLMLMGYGYLSHDTKKIRKFFAVLFAIIIAGTLYYFFQNVSVSLIVFFLFIVIFKYTEIQIEKTIHISIVLFMIVLMYMVFQGLLTVVEFISSIGMLLGTYWLAHSKIRIGWALYGFAHCLSAYLGFAKGQIIFGIFQGLSVFAAVIGIGMADKKY